MHPPYFWVNCRWANRHSSTTLEPCTMKCLRDGKTLNLDSVANRPHKAPLCWTCWSRLRHYIAHGQQGSGPQNLFLQTNRQHGSHAPTAATHNCTVQTISYALIIAVGITAARNHNACLVARCGEINHVHVITRHCQCNPVSFSGTAGSARQLGSR